MNPIFDVIVVGGGIVGLSAAIAMRQRGFSVAILDAGALTADTSTPDSRVFALNKASQHLLDTLGAWDALDKTRISPYTHMHVWDAANGADIDFDARMVGGDRLGVIVEQSVIKQALLQQVSALDITLYPHCTVNHVQPTLDVVNINDDANRSWQTQLLIAADGAASATRQLLGTNITSWPYHQQAIVTTVRTEKSHQQTAYQVFNPDGPLAFLPLTDPHQCSIVWSTSPQRAQGLMNLPDDEFASQLTHAFANKLGHALLISKRHQFPLHMRHTKQYTGPRWLLMGDAAHTIHPLAGLGLNVGLADLAAWLTLLDADKKQVGSTKMLGAYQRQRKYALWQTIALMDGLKMLFANPLPPIVALRGLGLRACNRLSPLKRLFIEHAAGFKN